MLSLIELTTVFQPKNFDLTAVYDIFGTDLSCLDIIVKLAVTCDHIISPWVVNVH